MDEAILRDLWGRLVLSEIIGSYQKKELVFCDSSDRSLKFYIYCEKNHNHPHVHVYWKKDYKISISISNQEILAGEMPKKNLKAVKEWIEEYRENLLKAWNDIQVGNKPELSWTKHKTGQS